MAQTNVENNFTKGLITEATGLNFPENAATSASNCIFTLVGDVTRRSGFNFEGNYNYNTVVNNNSAISTFKWDNAGGDGQTQIVVNQIGTTIYFYLSSAATLTSPLSSQLLSSTVNLTNYTAVGGTFDATLECQYASGNGYLFIFHPSTDPVYCSYQAGVITSGSIILQIRDFTGLPEAGVITTARPLGLTNYHQYNLINQGWASEPQWNFTSSSLIGISLGGTAQFTDAPAGLSITAGGSVTIQGGIAWIQPGATEASTSLFTINGTVTSYSGNTLDVTVNQYVNNNGLPVSGFIQKEIWYVQQGAAVSYISSWKTDVGSYPSNADVWWTFKDNTGTFNPGSTINNITLSSPAPKGSVILNAFNQQPTLVTSVPGLGITSTTVRPRTGCWWQGRVFYAGVDASSYGNGVTTQFYTWTENIYFSQVVQQTTDFANCYQQNDPTSETLFDLLPTDGGIITIPGSGAIYKLFPVQNGMLVFAANGIWFITGSTGIGFSATDYTIVQISKVQSINGSSFVDVLGLPFFWNAEGIYQVTANQTGSLSVNPITVGTILTYYNNIPLISRKYVRGAYDPINYIIQWTFRSTSETGVASRYQFDSILNFNTYNKAFYPYTFTGTTCTINSIVYVTNPGGSVAEPEPQFKYLVQTPSNNFTFAEENDSTTYFDFYSYDNVGTNYTSTFTTGYKVHGGALNRFQTPYLYVYCRGPGLTSYIIQSIWDYAASTASGRVSTRQVINNLNPNYGNVYKRHRLRGRGVVVQFEFTSVTGEPFDIMGWAVLENVNQGV